ncbi:hypothetical protein BC830DRAFT_1159809 [Chytriomyces sp. MP71]|nr:hypothetical protein BC830DRAFT_1159809 [Chytriomyces sp. MP71]
MAAPPSAFFTVALALRCGESDPFAIGYARHRTVAAVDADTPVECALWVVEDARGAPGTAALPFALGRTRSIRAAQVPLMRVSGQGLTGPPFRSRTVSSASCSAATLSCSTAPPAQKSRF